MPKAHSPRRGSTQYWPRKRSKYSLARIGSWAQNNQTKLLGFIGYKAGMTHLLVNDNRPKSLTKGEIIAVPATIIDCPPMKIMGVSFYQNSKKVSQVLAEKQDKNLNKKIQLPKKIKVKIEDVKEFDDLRLLVHSQPKLTSTGAKKPKILEIALGGSKEDKLKFAQENLGKEIKINDVFEGGNSLDVHGITKGKGFQGTVKRFGVAIKQHKGEKTKRGIGNLGAWTPKRVDFTVPQPGKMGYHLRTEYNKQVLKVGEKGEEVTRKAGIQKYGKVKGAYLLIKGSLPGSRKRALVLTQSIRPDRKMTHDAPEIIKIAK